MASRGGSRPGAGNPGYGKVNAVKVGVEKLTPAWFELTEKWLKGKDKRLQTVAYQELGKLMNKMMPVELGTENGPIEFVIKHYGNHPSSLSSSQGGDTV